MKGQRGSRGTLYLSLTSVVEGVGGQCHTSAALTTGKDSVPIVWEGLVRPQSRSGWASEAYRTSNGQDIPLPLIYYQGHYSLWLGFILNQMNPIHTIRTCSLRSTSILPSHHYLSLTGSLPYFTILTTPGNL